MVHGQNEKTAISVAPVSLNDDTATSIAVDSAGYTHATFELTVGATTGAISVFKVQSSTTSGGSYADVSGASLSTLPGATDDNKVYAIHVPLASANQFLKTVLTEDGTGTGVYGVNVRLQRISGGTPESASDRGYAAEVFA